ncbi:MAG TPA: WYL domain-containing protein, partial [Pseudonocardia sp.]
DAPCPTGARFRPRELPADDAATFVRSRLRNLPTSYEVELLVEAPADAIRARIGRWVRVEDAGEGRCRVRMHTDSLDWAALTVGTTEAACTVVSPPELREHLRTWGARFARAAG